jgi:hypothetical protein
MKKQQKQQSTVEWLLSLARLPLIAVGNAIAIAYAGRVAASMAMAFGSFPLNEEENPDDNGGLRVVPRRRAA